MEEEKYKKDSYLLCRTFSMLGQEKEEEGERKINTKRHN